MRVRRRVPLEELEADRVLDLLADSRLVTVSEGTAEVAHEALLREWPRLRGWLEEDADGRRLHAQLTHAAREWNRDDRDRGELYRGARLASALEWRAAHEPELNTIEQQFLDASRVASERARRRIQLVLAGVLALLVVTAGAALLALDQRGRARAQTRRPKRSGSALRRSTRTRWTSRCCWPGRASRSTTARRPRPASWPRCAAARPPSA